MEFISFKMVGGGCRLGRGQIDFFFFLTAFHIVPRFVSKVLQLPLPFPASGCQNYGTPWGAYQMVFFVPTSLERANTLTKASGVPYRFWTAMTCHSGHLRGLL